MSLILAGSISLDSTFKGRFCHLKFEKSMINLKKFYGDSPTHHSDSPTLRVGELMTYWVGESTTCQLAESVTPRLAESASRFSITNISANSKLKLEQLEM